MSRKGAYHRGFCRTDLDSGAHFTERGRLLVLYAPSPEAADGLLQWPETRALIEGRLGPTALIVAEANTRALQARLDALGISELAGQ